MPLSAAEIDTLGKKLVESVQTNDYLKVFELLKHQELVQAAERLELFFKIKLDAPENIVYLLLTSGVDPNCVSRYNGKKVSTALMHFRNNVHCILLLKQFGADNRPDYAGWDPLMWARHDKWLFPVQVNENEDNHLNIYALKCVPKFFPKHILPALSTKTQNESDKYKMLKILYPLISRYEARHGGRAHGEKYRPNKAIAIRNYL